MSEKQKEQSSFERLYEIDVSGFVKKKNKFDYISWASAMGLLLKADPDANFVDHDPVWYGDTCMVSVSVTAFGKTMRSRMPVIDFKNQPISNPNAMAINTAYQRCLAKAIALHGLGLSVYQGEDIDSLFDEMAQNSGAYPMNKSGDKEVDKWHKALIADMNNPDVVSCQDDLDGFLKDARIHDNTKKLTKDQKDQIKQQADALTARFLEE